MFSRNRKLYVDEMKSKGVSAFILLKNRRFDTFDDEMVRVTANVFVNAQPSDRVICINDFVSTWKTCVQSADADIISMRSGFESLRMLIEEARDKIDAKKKSHAVIILSLSMIWVALSTCAMKN